MLTNANDKNWEIWRLKSIDFFKIFAPQAFAMSERFLGGHLPRPLRKPKNLKFSKFISQYYQNKDVCKKQELKY